MKTKIIIIAIFCACVCFAKQTSAQSKTNVFEQLAGFADDDDDADTIKLKKKPDFGTKKNGTTSSTNNSTARQRAREIIEKRKRDFFNKEMELTKEEEAQFWPIYNTYETKRRAISREHKLIDKDFIRRKATISEAECKTMVDKLRDIQKRSNDLNFKYYQVFETILSAKKILLLHRAEDEYQRGLLRSLESSQSGVTIQRYRR